MYLVQTGIVSLFVLLSSLIVEVNAQPKASYPQKVVDQYVENCTAIRGAQARSICRCIINGTQSVYSYEEFNLLNKQIEQTGKLTGKLSKIVADCKGYPNSY